jgi:hypothetical protein
MRFINRGGSSFLLNKTQSPSLRVGLEPKPDFFIYVVKPEPELSQTLVVNFSSPKNPEPDPSLKKSGPTYLYSLTRRILWRACRSSIPTVHKCTIDINEFQMSYNRRKIPSCHPF